MPSFFEGYAYNFWQDAEHVRGLWRRTPVSSYLSATPAWETLLDIDALVAAEDRNWVFANVDLLIGEPHRAMVALSDGGRDAVTWREFDLDARCFLAAGFVVAESKTTLTWQDRDTLLVATPTDDQSLTTAGYPRQLRRWRRGTPLASAALIAEVAMDAMSISAFNEIDGDRAYPGIVRAHAFWRSSVSHLRQDGGEVASPLPDTATLASYLQGRFIAKLHADWRHQGRDFAAGSLVAYAIEPLLAGTHPRIELVLDAPPRGAIEDVAASQSVLYVVITEDVVSKLLVLRRDADGAWLATPIAVPGNASINLITATRTDDLLLFGAEGMTLPRSLFACRDGGSPVKTAGQAPRFNARDMLVEQRFATSADGTRVPYFLVRPRDAMAVPT